MDLSCPKCNSTDLKKVSVAYEEGMFRTESRTRLRAAAVGGGGPDLIVGRTTTHETQQSALSNKLTPPTKWSYRKAVFWSVLVFLSVGWLVFYANTVVTKASSVSSTALMLFGLISGGIFVLLLILVWRHNHATYQHRFADWDRSFICLRCGSIGPCDFSRGSLS